MSDPSLLSPEYNGTKLLTFTAIFIPTQIIAVALRYLARYLVEGPWGLDDILILTSLTLQICMGGISIGRWFGSLHVCGRKQIIDAAKDLSTTPELAITRPIWRRQTRKYCLFGANTLSPFLSFTLAVSTSPRLPFWRCTITSSPTRKFVSGF